MRRTIGMILICGIMLTLFGCSPNQSGRTLNAANNQVTASVNTNEIVQTQLTSRESMLLSSVTDNSFVFSYKTDSTYNWVTVWEERHEKGNKVAKGFLLSGGFKPGTTGMLYISAVKDEKKCIEWKINAFSDGFKASNSFKDSLQLGQSAGAYTNIQSAKITKDEIALAYLYFTKQNQIRTVDIGDSGSLKKAIDNLQGDDVCYLIKCKFSNI